MSEGDKPELNPYESPREAEPLTKEQIAKRAVGVGALILLTPPAMIIAVLCCCSASSWLKYRYGGWIDFGGPFLVLTALMTVGIFFDRSRASTVGPKGLRTGLFVATPFVVAGATVIGIVFAAFAYPLQSVIPMLVAFYVPPALALLFMLRLIWQAK